MALLVNFLLFKYQMKEPKTKADMLNIASKEYGEDHFTEIFVRASVYMELTFGLDVKEVDPTNRCYAILIKMGLTSDGILRGEKETPKTSILILILGVIFMKGNCATREEVWEVLSVKGFYLWRKHYIFGKHRKLITNHFMEEECLKYNTSRRPPVILHNLNSCGAPEPC
ncbi:melanoma-associated antigen B16-like [Artibeus jamaicensis]|uniref:melanoma-associated antigen B16-like n=1 Tax=Artibeus jamaicensis TaxID=9417 RepID=UPI00235AC4E3|nr:melanoma-associated antigen B16-like [Artibeus jamaicensis]